MKKFHVTVGFMLGRLEADGSFFISIRNKPTNVNGYSIRLGFQLAQHSKDIMVFERVIAFLGIQANIQNTSAPYKALYGVGQVKRILITHIMMITTFIIPYYWVTL